MSAVDLKRDDPALRFTHSPLIGSKIRLLQLQPWDAENCQISCSLITVDLDDPSIPEYVALSYTWQKYKPQGPEEPEEDAVSPSSKFAILCDGATLDIQENLYDLLQRLSKPDARDSNQHEFLWADAVCINQEDNDERSAQVLMMSRIYSQAGAVLIWLGEEDSHSELAIPLIETMSRGFRKAPCYNATTVCGHKIDDPELMSQMGVEVMSIESWGPVIDFLERPWFYRLWIVQEFAFAGSVTVMCGFRSLLWNDLEDFTNCVQLHGWAITLAMRFPGKTFGNGGFGMDTILSMRNKYVEGSRKRVQQSQVEADELFGMPTSGSFASLTYAWLLMFSRKRDASDPRDYVFAPLTMVSKEDNAEMWTKILPDYNKSAREVFILISQWLLVQFGLVALFLIEPPSLRNENWLPSWVVDWRMNSVSLPMQFLEDVDVFYNTAYPATKLYDGHDFRLVSSSMLEVTGTMFATVLEVSEGWIMEGIAPDLVSLIEVARPKERNSTMSDDWLRTMMLTLVGDAAGSKILARADGAEPFTNNELEAMFQNWLTSEISIRLFKWYIETEATEVEHWWTNHSTIEEFCGSVPLFPTKISIENRFSEFLEFFDAEEWDFFHSVHISRIDPLFARLLQSRVPYRCLIRTSSGNLGLAPAVTRNSDQVWLLKGAKCPYILRKKSQDQYEFIGEVYVQGIMHGEAFQDASAPSFETITLV